MSNNLARIELSNCNYFHFKKPTKKKLWKLTRGYVPILRWLPRYSAQNLHRDVIAGLTVCLVMIPQGLAYSTILDLPPQYGLYSSFMASYVYSIFGPSKYLSLGPSALLCLVVAGYIHSSAALAIALSFFSGIVLLLLGLFRMGVLFNLISFPVISGFTSSITFSVGTSQIKTILGLKNIPSGFFSTVYGIFSHIADTNNWDLVMGLSCVTLLIFLQQLSRLDWEAQGTTSQSVLACAGKRFLWFAVLARNALVLLLSAVVVFAFEVQGLPHSFTSTGNNTEESQLPAFPSFKLPFHGLQYDGNSTSMMEILSELGSGVVVVPFVGLLETITVAKVFGRINNVSVDANQELIALGIANCLGSFISAYPVCGSFTRTTVNCQSGVATQAGCIATGTLVLLALFILRPYFNYIPKAALAAVVFIAVSTLLDFRTVKHIWRINKIDLLPLAVTFFCCIYKVQIGILAGVAVSAIILFYRSLKPRLIIKGGEEAVIKVNGGLIYAGVAHFESKLQKLAYRKPRPVRINVDLSCVTEFDFTVVQSFRQITAELKSQNIQVKFWGIQKHVLEMLDKANINGNLVSDQSVYVATKSDVVHHNYCSSV